MIEEENSNWQVKRMLSKLNYLIHTDAIKEKYLFYKNKMIKEIVEVKEK